MRFDNLSRKLMQSIFISSVLVLAILIMLPHFTSAQSGIGVDNDGPSFTEISIVEVDDVIFVDVIVRDLNGWNNIYSINVTVYDEQSRIISRVNFTQYANLTTDILFAQFNQDKRYGEYLNGEFSTSTYVEISPWNPDNTVIPIGLSVRFAYNKFAGNTIEILCTDKAENPLSCDYSGPFSAEYTPPSVFGDNVAIPISLSGVIAALGALFMAYRRFKNNKLARAVEASERGK